MADFANMKISDSTIQRLDNSWGHLLWVGDDGHIAIEAVLDFLKP